MGKKKDLTVSAERTELVNKGFVEVKIDPITYPSGMAIEEVITSSPESKKFAVHNVPVAKKATTKQLTAFLEKSDIGKRILKAYDNDSEKAIAVCAVRVLRFDIKNEVRNEITKVVSDITVLRDKMKSAPADVQAKIRARLADLLSELE